MVNAVILGRKIFSVLSFFVGREFSLGLLVAIHVDDELAGRREGILERGADSFKLGIISLDLCQNLGVVYL
jgi:hypothetical protein